ncbi:MAG: prepilin-type N-terminal cleavage/methylation domain-containing protein [Desulfobacterium sp.]|nr:prepilin-type N-terminal cleavage/methylation domain-containing protein [Desulfobacterium sp.]MBU3948234.1 prepilin-type N-terminal cleavage/methylation domain-containing protein [Pseudomonadota bacterium]MBU4009719.1 prepilin-type N-terminal cleavage/methylation domain-containing protein [Pseudomonadota bacterium]MBU4037810.1 prepilin-type N-terminal cleavage/methylation domain-containing protein [Pseudomonadota bacterium]
MIGNKAPRLFRVNTNGFTLIELMITIAISSIAMFAIYGVFISSNHAYRTQEGAVDAQQRARVGLDLMVRNIRMAGLDPLGSAGAGIEVATASNIRFTADVDMTGAIDTANDERLTYNYNNVDTLNQIRYEGTASQNFQPMLDRVRALTFTYRNAAGGIIVAPVTGAALANIRSVDITITCDGVGERGQILTRTLSTRVNCRNIGI